MWLPLMAGRRRDTDTLPAPSQSSRCSCASSSRTSKSAGSSATNACSASDTPCHKSSSLHASLPRVAAGRPHGLWHAHLPIHPSRLTPRGPAHPGTTWTSCSTSAICRSCELSCTFYRSLSQCEAQLLGALRCTLKIGNRMLLCKVYSFFICSFYFTTVAAWKYRHMRAAFYRVLRVCLSRCRNG